MPSELFGFPFAVNVSAYFNVKAIAGNVADAGIITPCYNINEIVNSL